MVHQQSASLFRPANKVDQCRLFFSDLNYDVRSIIYDQLYLHLPPLCLDKDKDIDWRG